MGGIVLVSVLSVALGLNLIYRFVQYGIGLDLVTYRTTILKMEMEKPLKQELVYDLELLRNSINERNRIGFFRWLSADTSIRNILDDEKISPEEYAILKAEILALKRAQGLEK